MEPIPMSLSRLELLPPGVLDLALSQLTCGDLARALFASKTLCAGVQVVASSLALGLERPSARAAVASADGLGDAQRARGDERSTWPDSRQTRRVL